ncbi:hypothetical protein [uncultured Nostoc sp.]|uniref:hypothetical protein n=1 Tax=uncultured Nostoc sp. TaxID=340711 RepID=UPI0035CAF83F
MKYYFYRCYYRSNSSVGLLYTSKNDTVLLTTNRNLAWCKKWKTLAGAKKNLEKYNKLWQEEHEEGFLKIEEIEWDGNSIFNMRSGS